MEKEPKFSKKIEELKNKIYSKKANLKPKARSVLDERPHEVSDTFKDDEIKKIIKKPSKSLLQSTMFRKLFFGSVLFFFVSVVFGAYMFFWRIQHCFC